MEAIIGVVGTILGTILGWLLNSLSQKGKLRFYIKNWNDTFKHINEIGEMVPSKNIEESECYTFSLSIDAYNSSSETKIMRDILILFMDSKKVIKRITPKDFLSQRFAARTYHYDDIGPMNISPKTIATIELYYNDSEELYDYLKTTSVYLQYTDERDREIKVHVKNLNFSSHFQKNDGTLKNC